MSVLNLNIKRGFDSFTLNVNTSIEVQGITAVFGPSGSGKTSLLRAIAGLEPTEGLVEFGGVQWQGPKHSLPTHKRGVGYVFQEASLLPHLSVQANLDFAQNASAKMLKAEAFSQKRIIECMGIEALLGRNPADLSGGQRQRVAIACAVLTQPALLLMDEPLASLDAYSKAEILPYIASLPKQLGVPVLYVSHSLEEVVRLADAIVLMDGGSIVAHGETNALLTDAHLPLTALGEACAVVQAVVSEYIEEDHLAAVTCSAGSLLLSAVQLQKNSAASNSTSNNSGINKSSILPKVGEPVRVAIAAKDVSIALVRPAQTSISSVLAAKVLDINPTANPAQALVRLNAAGNTLLARITQRSVRLLELHPGKAVFAQVKSVSLMD